MGTPYIGEIRMFGGNFAPQGWSFCDGRLLAISENDALFNLIGTTYGGDGQSTFALPDLQERLPVHQGNGFPFAQTGGVDSVTLTQNQLPTHTHTLEASADAATDRSPEGNVPATASRQVYGAGSLGPMSKSALAPVGATSVVQAHDNRQPFLCVSFIISLYGVYPSQN